MKKLISSLLNYLRYLYGYVLYEREYREFRKQEDKRFVLDRKHKKPCVMDRFAKTSFDKHYTYHTAWAARKVADHRPSSHIDVSSLTYFSTLVSAFVPVKFFDYRPEHIELDNLAVDHCDITALPFPDDSVDSLSCMHVVEHIGLARYGDPLDPKGDLKAIQELTRVLSPNGYLLFVVPIGGVAKILFNAHRIYTFAQIVGYFNDLELLEFSLIPDQSDQGLIINATEEQANQQDYGCGCFLFRKQGSIDGHQ